MKKVFFSYSSISDSSGDVPPLENIITETYKHQPPTKMASVCKETRNKLKRKKSHVLQCHENMQEFGLKFKIPRQLSCFIIWYNSPFCSRLTANARLRQLSVIMLFGWSQYGDHEKLAVWFQHQQHEVSSN